MSAGAILCVVFFIAWIATRNEPARRRQRRREFEHTAMVERAREQMTRDLRPSYPPPPVLPADDIR